MKQFTTHNRIMSEKLKFRIQRWTIKIHNNISKATELLTRLLAKGYFLLEDLTFSKGFYSFKLEYKIQL